MENQAHFEQIVNHIGDMIYQLDLNGYFVYLNKEILKKTEYECNDLIGKHYSLLLRTEHLKKVEQFFRKIYEFKKENAIIEIPFRTKNHVEFWVEKRVNLIICNEKIIGFQALVRDVSKDKKQKDDLIYKKKIAEETTKKKSKFLAGMSHEIRTPLYGIIGINKLLERTTLTPKQMKFVEAIKTASDQLMSVINEILDFSKMEASEIELHESEIDISDLIQSIISVFELKNENEKIRFTYFIDKTIPRFIFADVFRLRQVLYNLIGNASKFTKKGEVKVEVKLLEQNAEKIWVEFTISDSGVGISKDHLEMIFDCFSQVGEENLSTEKGTGLGLAIVKKLIKLLGGRIAVQSNLKIGTVFTIHLPFKSAYTSLFPKNDCEKIKLKQSNICVLLVEDNSINQMVTSGLLEEEGAIVYVAENGLHALDMLENKTPDIIILDLLMPILDGYETIKIIRNSKNQSYNKIPIIALSANIDRLEIEKSLRDGANDYLTKPVKPELLYEKINELIHTNCNLENNSTLKEERLDLETFKSYFREKNNIVKSTLVQMGQSFEQDIAKLRELIQSDNGQLIRMVAHRLKPSFAMLGMSKHAELCRKLEDFQKEKERQQQTLLLLELIPIVIKDIQSLTNCLN